jgi:hypothetical protein
MSVRIEMGRRELSLLRWVGYVGGDLRGVAGPVCYAEECMGSVEGEGGYGTGCLEADLYSA